MSRIKWQLARKICLSGQFYEPPDRWPEHFSPQQLANLQAHLDTERSALKKAIEDALKAQEIPHVVKTFTFPVTSFGGDLVFLLERHPFLEQLPAIAANDFAQWLNEQRETPSKHIQAWFNSCCTHTAPVETNSESGGVEPWKLKATTPEPSATVPEPQAAPVMAVSAFDEDGLGKILAMAGMAILNIKVAQAEATNHLENSPTAMKMLNRLVELQEKKELKNQTPEPQAATSPAPVPQGNVMKKAALIAALEHEWPSIEPDISDATRNGLKTAAHTGKHGDWNKDKARAWAVSKGKIKQAAPLHAWPGLVTRYTIDDK